MNAQEKQRIKYKNVNKTPCFKTQNSKTFRNQDRNVQKSDQGRMGKDGQGFQVSFGGKGLNMDINQELFESDPSPFVNHFEDEIPGISGEPYE